jgi:carbamate kinase
MAPKIDAACNFIEGGGKRALITDISTVQEAIDGSAGTWITA